MTDPTNPLHVFQHHDFFITSHDLTPYSVGSNYAPLAMVLCAAFAQAEGGKGKERHALGDPFMEQPILSIGRLLKSADGEAYQVVKKLREGLQMAKRGQYDAAIREFLGAINYLAAVAILTAEEQHSIGRKDYEPKIHSDFATSRAEGMEPATETITHRHIDADGTMREVDIPLRPHSVEPWTMTPCPSPKVDPTEDQLYAALRRQGRSRADSEEIAESAMEWYRIPAGKRPKYKMDSHIRRAREAVGEWIKSEVSEGTKFE